MVICKPNKYNKVMLDEFKGKMPFLRNLEVMDSSTYGQVGLEMKNLTLFNCHGENEFKSF